MCNLYVFRLCTRAPAHPLAYLRTLLKYYIIIIICRVPSRTSARKSVYIPTRKLSLSSLYLYIMCPRAKIRARIAPSGGGQFGPVGINGITVPNKKIKIIVIITFSRSWSTVNNYYRRSKLSAVGPAAAGS